MNFVVRKTYKAYKELCPLNTYTTFFSRDVLNIPLVIIPVLSAQGSPCKHYFVTCALSPGQGAAWILCK